MVAEFREALILLNHRMIEASTGEGNICSFFVCTKNEPRKTPRYFRKSLSRGGSAPLAPIRVPDTA